MSSFLPPAKPRPQARYTRVRDRVGTVEVHGSGKIELFDADSRRKVEEVPFRNFIANPGMDRIRWMTRHAIGLGFGQETDDYEVGRGGTGYPEFWDLATGNVWEGEYADVFSHIVLNADDAAEDPATEYAPRLFTHPPIAWANRDAYAGADTKRGSINFAEVRRNPERIILVFDWPTSSGNGTFRSIQFAHLHESDLRASLLSATGPSLTFSGVGSTATGAVDDGTGLGAWVSDGTNTTAGNASLRRCAYADGAVLASITYSALGSMRPAGVGLDVVSGDLWVEQNNAQGDSIKRVTTLGAIITTLTIPSPLDTGHRGLAYGDGKLFLSAYIGSSTYRIAQLNQSTGAVIDSVDITTTETTYSDVGGLSFNEATGTLFFRGSNADGTVLYEMDPDTLDIINSYSFASGSDNLHLIWRSGTDLLAYLGHYVSASSGQVLRFLRPESMLGSRTLLGGDVSKTSLQTMKITYQFDFA